MSSQVQAQILKFFEGDSAALEADDIKEMIRVDAEEAREFLEGTVTAVELDLGQAVGGSLVTYLVNKGDVARLSDLAEHAGKELGKEARRGVHRLRVQGTQVDIARTGAREKLTAAQDRPEAWFAPPDGSGETLIALIVPAPGRGYHVIYVHVSDQTGLLEVMAGVGPRRLWRDLGVAFFTC